MTKLRHSDGVLNLLVTSVSLPAQGEVWGATLLLFSLTSRLLPFLPPIFLIFCESYSLSVLSPLDFLVLSKTSSPMHMKAFFFFFIAWCLLASLQNVFWKPFPLLTLKFSLTYQACLFPISIIMLFPQCFHLDKHLLRDVVCLFFFFSFHLW